MYSEKYEDLLADGFSSKYASYYLNLASKEYDNPAYSFEYVEWAHQKGFLAESAAAYGLSKKSNLNDYLSDYDFYKIWPLNSWNRVWINDKLTLKYMLANTEFSDFMPKYYYYTAEDGLKKLVDAPNQELSPSVDEFKRVLSEVGEFACKPCNGTTSIGFKKLTYRRGDFFLNNELLLEGGVSDFISKNPNYVFTEYIKPSKQFLKFSPIIHTLRIVTLNETGSNPRIIGGYLRIPHNKSGEANYIVLGKDSTDNFNIVLNVDFDTGDFESARLTFANRTEIVECHPDTMVPLKGAIENYQELKKTVLNICRRFSTIEYMGFDIGVTDSGFKCMEINSHPGIKYMQLFTPLLKNKDTKDYFNQKIMKIDSLQKKDKEMRNYILR